jgi:uncharacterized protein (TIGR03083 family)
MTIDLGEIYRSTRLRVAELVDDSVGDLAVPATPAWNTHDVVAHLAGVLSDVAAGNLEGVATDPWTAAQVELGRGKPISRLVDEWAEAAIGFEAFLSSPSGTNASAAIMDVSCHETDIRTALGLAPTLTDEMLAWAAGTMRESFDSQVAAAGLPAVKVDVPDFELFRGRLGRRTRDEVAAFGWSADPAPYLGIFFIFGPTDHPVGV